MGKIMLNEISYSGGGGGNANIVRLTQDEYDALPSSKLTDDKVYMITDVNGDDSQFQPVIYSENEREIGVWIDGKPLYEKTINSDITLSNTFQNYFSTSGIDKIIDVINPIVYRDGEQISMAFSNNGVADWRVQDGYLKVSVQGIITGETWLLKSLTLRYTKTTDQAGSGTWTPQGVPAVHYSTDEQVVGTWIDGSTLYEKTIEFDGSSQSITDNMTINNGIENADFICIKDAWFIDPKISSKASSSNIITKLPYTQNSSSFLNVVIPLNDKTKIKFSSSETFTAYEGRKIIVILQYTKTQGGA